MVNITSEIPNLFLETFPGFLSIRNQKHEIIYLNENFRNWIAQYTDVEPIGKTNVELAALVPTNVGDTFLQCHDGSLDLERKNVSVTGLSKVIEFKSEDENPVHSQYFDVWKYKVVIEQEIHIFTVSNDITDLYMENQYNRVASLTDPMTGAYNRRYFEINSDLLYGHWCAIFDLDKFKLVNDFEGHCMGDKVLKKFVSFLENIKDIIAVIRLGGDEFAGIFRSGIDKQQIQMELQIQRKKFEEIYKQYKYLSFSFGVGMAEHSLEQTVQKIDSMVYEDKRRNC